MIRGRGKTELKLAAEMCQHKIFQAEPANKMQKMFARVAETEIEEMPRRTRAAAVLHIPAANETSKPSTVSNKARQVIYVFQLI